MKALTLHQPWASLVAIRAKCFETRSWPAPRTLQPGDLLAIHAATRSLRVCWRELLLDSLNAYLAASNVLKDGLGSANGLPLGGVVAVCEFVSCSRTEYRAPHVTPQELLFGDWTPGRYAWELRVLYRLPEPIPARGRQGLWEWEPPAIVSARLQDRAAAVVSQREMQL